MWHTIVIAIHAVAAGVALLAGCVAIRRGALFGTYLWSLVAMEAFLVLAIAAEWSVIDVIARVLFAAIVSACGNSPSPERFRGAQGAW